jgi:uncharacterized FlaG/YvyC family protein
MIQIQFGYGQGTYRVSIKIIDEDTQKEVPKLGISLMENGRGLGVGTTDGNGIATIIIPRTTRNITLVLTSKDIEIKYPRGGETHAPSPEIENPTVEFLVKTSLFRMMALQIEHLSQEKKELENLADSLKLKMYSDQISFKDSLEKISDQINHLLIEITNKKLALYSEISNNYLQFLNAILDMELTLKQVSNTFIQEGELRNFNRQIEILNHARNSMHENHLAYVQVVEKYWNSDSSEKLKGLYHQALQNTYGDIILPLNEELISKLKDSWNGNKPRILVQRKAVKSTKKALTKLHDEIEELKITADEVLALLESDVGNE